ncbi:MAG TPA: hypothetical protein VFT82_01160 [Candidatus Paceibacterota bacterium]|nr:hypothetical protein [Candidatus Paceibacterota bacterium]
MMTREEAEENMVRAWREYDRAEGREKLRLFFSLADLAAEYEKKGIVPIEMAAYRICHAGLGAGSDMPAEFEEIFDEACDLELGEDFVPADDLRRRWDALILQVEHLKKKFGVL